MRWDSSTGAISANFMDELTLVGHKGFVAAPSRDIPQDQDPVSAVAQAIQNIVEEHEANILAANQITDDTENKCETTDGNPEAQECNAQEETEGIHLPSRNISQEPASWSLSANHTAMEASMSLFHPHRKSSFVLV